MWAAHPKRTTVTEKSVLSPDSVRVRRQVRRRCTEFLSRIRPDPELGGATGIWHEERTHIILTAVLEIQRVEHHSELETAHIQTDLIVILLEELSNQSSRFNESRGRTLLCELDRHFRILGAALRLYKYHGKSLDQKIYLQISNGIKELQKIFHNNSDQGEARHL